MSYLGTVCAVGSRPPVPPTSRPVVGNPPSPVQPVGYPLDFVAPPAPPTRLERFAKLLETPEDQVLAFACLALGVVGGLMALLGMLILFASESGGGLPFGVVLFLPGLALVLLASDLLTQYKPAKERRIAKEKAEEELKHQRWLDGLGRPHEQHSTQIKLKEMDHDDNRHARQSELDRLVLTIAGQREQLEMQETSAAALEEIRQKYGLKVETRKLLGGLQQTRITLASQERMATSVEQASSQDAADEHVRGMERLGKEQQGRLDELASVQTHDLIKAMLSELLSRTDKDQQMKDLITSLEASEGVYEWANSATDPNEQRRRRATAEAAVQDILRGGKGG